MSVSSEDAKVCAPCAPAGHTDGAVGESCDREAVPAARGLGCHDQPLTAPALGIADLSGGPISWKPPALWGDEAAAALKRSLQTCSEGEFAMLILALSERATPDFIVALMADPPAPSPRWEACLACLMPYVATHTRAIERSSLFLTASIDGPCIRNTNEALENWLKEAVAPEATQGRLDEVVHCDLERLLEILKCDSDVLRFYFDYTTDAQFASAFAQSLILFYIENGPKAEGYLKAVPGIVRRTRAWIESHESHRFAVFAREHGAGELLSDFARRQALAPVALMMASDAGAFRSITQTYGAFFAASALRCLPRHAALACLNDLSSPKFVSKVARLLNLNLDGLDTDSLPIGLTPDMHRGDAKSFQVADASESDSECNSRTSMPGAVEIGTYTESDDNLHGPLLGDETAIFHLGDLAGLGRATGGICCSDSEDEQPAVEISIADEVVQGEREFARALRFISETHRHERNLTITLKCARRVIEIQDRQLRVHVWRHLLMHVLEGCGSNSDLAAVLSTVSESDREDVMSHRNYDIVAEVVQKSVLGGTQPAELFTPPEMLSYLHARRTTLPETVTEQMLPWMFVEAVANALDAAGMLVLLDILRETASLYLPSVS